MGGWGGGGAGGAVVVVQHKTSDQYLTLGHISSRPIEPFKRNRLLKTLTKIIKNKFEGSTNAYTDAVVSATAPPVLNMYRRAKNDHFYTI